MYGGRSLRFGAILTATLAAGCASFRTVDTTPLSPTQLQPPNSDAISAGGYRLAALSTSGQLPDLFLLVAMSGGGKRSAAFSFGALQGMQHVMIPTPQGDQPLLSELSAITAVSGGSFTAAYYGLYRHAAFARYKQDFLYKDTEANIWGIYLLPWNWSWVVDPSVGTNDFMERVYDETMFHGATFKDLAALDRPIIGIGATDINYGTPFAFTQEYFDVLCADLAPFPLARAVAASNGFPGLFSPITLTNRVAKCGGRKPGWERRVTDAERRDPLSRLGNQAKNIDRYLDPGQTRYVHLADGGIADNLALRGVGGMMQNLAESSTALTKLGYDRLRRILVISIDGQGSQDSSVAQRKSVGGLLSLFGLVSGGQVDRYNFETLYTVTGQIRQAVEAIRTARCTQGRIIDGAPCDDVQGKLIHVSLMEMPDSPEKAALLAIPTGLTLNPRDVDLLIAAGETAISSSQPLRRFLDSYPPRAAQNASRAAIPTDSRPD